MEINDGTIMPSEVESIKNACLSKGIEDPGLVLDVFRVLSMKGKTRFLSDEDILKDANRLDPKFWERKTQINTRKDFLESLADSHYVQALIELDSPLKGVTVFIEHLEQAAAAKAESRKSRRAITGVRYNEVDGGFGDSELEALRPIVESLREQEETFDDFVATLNRYDSICESEEVSAFFCGCGLGSSYSASNFGGALAKEVVENGTKLPKDYPILYKEFTRIVDLLGASTREPVASPEEQASKKVDRMEDFSQVDSVDPADMAREEFDINLSQKKLEVKHNIEEKSGTCHLFVLLDVSGSMQGCDVGGVVCRAFASNIVALSLLQFSMKDKWAVHIAPFTSRVGLREVQHATDRDSALSAMKWLGGQNYNGWNTDIECAVLWSYQELQKESAYRKCDIVLLTDGCSPLSSKLRDLKPAKTKLHTLVFGDHAISYSEENVTRLVEASDSMHSVGWNSATKQLDIGTGLNNLHNRNSND